MAFDESLASRVRSALARQRGVEEKKMFAGVGFLAHGSMLAGVWRNSLVVRVVADNFSRALTELYAHPFDITGKPLKGMGADRSAGNPDRGLPF